MVLVVMFSIICESLVLRDHLGLLGLLVYLVTLSLVMSAVLLIVVMC